MLCYRCKALFPPDPIYAVFVLELHDMLYVSRSIDIVRRLSQLRAQYGDFELLGLIRGSPKKTEQKLRRRLYGPLELDPYQPISYWFPRTVWNLGVLREFGIDPDQPKYPVHKTAAECFGAPEPRPQIKKKPPGRDPMIRHAGLTWIGWIILLAC
jgi:hypothetical protein